MHINLCKFHNKSTEGVSACVYLCICSLCIAICVCECWNVLFFLIFDTGSPNFPYGRKALDAALIQLYRFYRTSAVVWMCQDWEDWESMATVYRQEEQWPQVDMYASCQSLVRSVHKWIDLSIWHGLCM